MPELPEVETVCRGLAPVLEGRRLVRVEVRRAGLRQPFPERLVERLEGQRVIRVWRRAKYFVWDLEAGESILGHLGMSGRMTVSAETSPVVGPHDHLRLQTEERRWVTFCDPRRFGLFLLTPTEDLTRHPLLARLGPEPLAPEFTGSVFLSRLGKRASSIKAALLDQGVVAGIGNIYACESLFRAGIDPRRMAVSLSGPEVDKLVLTLKTVLEEAIVAGGSSLRDHRQADGELGYFQHSFAVYDREGQPCPNCTCDLARTGGVRRLVQSGRSTFFCAARQR